MKKLTSAKGLYKKISDLINLANSKVVHTVNSTALVLYWNWINQE